jgi:hypothetical protein
MTFSEKMVFLMRLTSTSNKQLAEAVKVDPSLISLLRTARRNAPKNLTHIRAMASYFAKRCDGNYQRMALSEVMGRGVLPSSMDTRHLTAVLLDWLLDGRDQTGQFLSTSHRFTFQEGDAEAHGGGGNAQNRVYYGNQGKRDAFSAFTELLLKLDGQGTILFTMDESAEWYFEDADYRARLRGQIVQLMERGYRVCRIAAPINTAEESFESLTEMLPLYLTGQMEAYCYPRLRDRVYQRTLAVLPGVAAVVSTSAGGQRVARATVLTGDARFTNAMAEEFRDYLAQCRPMIAAYSAVKDASELLRCLMRFEEAPGDRIQLSTTLSMLTTPESLARSVDEGGRIVDAAGCIQDLFHRSVDSSEVIDVQSLASTEEVCAGRVPIALSYLRGEAPDCYTPETYALHLRSIAACLEQHEKYHVLLRPRGARNCALMAKEGRKALILSTGTPTNLFEISRPNAAEACRAYLERLTELPQLDEAQRQETLAVLQERIQELECCQKPDFTPKG